MSNQLIIGFNGLRGSGKTTAAEYIQKNYGFIKGHAFNPGKAMFERYLEYCGVDKVDISKYVHGVPIDWRNNPCLYLPINKKTGEHYSCRYFMEEFGYWMGTYMGPDWTVGVELDTLQKWYDKTHIVFDSIVYEADLFKQRGGIIVRIERDGLDTSDISNKADKYIVEPDIIIQNNGTIGDLYDRLHLMIINQGLKQE